MSQLRGLLPFVQLLLFHSFFAHYADCGSSIGVVIAACKVWVQKREARVAHIAISEMSLPYFDGRKKGRANTFVWSQLLLHHQRNFLAISCQFPCA